jgi:predicted nucleotidyltransferase/uncharacterized protein YutE (UPF0331/DUF86 family)
MTRRSEADAAALEAMLGEAFDSSSTDVVSAYLFGSQAEGRAHAESDIDVGVLLDRDAAPTRRQRFEARVRIGSLLIGRLHHNEVDVVVLNDAPPELARRIVTSGKRVYRRDEAADHAFVRDVQLRGRSRAVPPPDPARQACGHGSMTFLVERLAQLRLHIDHLRAIRPRVHGPDTLSADLSLHNDVLFSLLTICQLVIDIAGELSARSGQTFEDYTQAVRNLSADERFPSDVVAAIERLPGFRNVLIHEYVALDMDRVMEALDELEPIERFHDIVTRIEGES